VVAFGVAVFAVYLANGRGATDWDVEATTYLPLAVLRGDGPFLDQLPEVQGHSVGVARGRRVSLYPLAPALLAVPLTAPQLSLLDALRPDWESHRYFFAVFMSKTSHAALVAALAALLLLLGLQLGAPWPLALLAALAGALGSTLWSVASQGAWQHGPAALGFGAALCLLSAERQSRTKLLLAGLCAALMVASRYVDVVFALALGGYVLASRGREAGPFFVFPVLVGAALLAFNLHYFGTLEGGQSQLEALHPTLHRVEGTWTGDLLEGGLGTLLSPSRGLFVFSPWTLLALVALPAAGVRTLPVLLRWLLPALAVYALLLSTYSCWWAGWSFGPRFWTDTLPLFVALFALVLTWAWRRMRWFVGLAALAVLVAIGIHGLGAFRYPSSWNASPRNVDLYHERLWDWRDTELSRLWKEPKPPSRRRPLWNWP
jgi:hypothetical protein